MRILVTGGSGFIGSHLCRELLSNGHEVFVYDNIGKKIAQFTSYEIEAGNYTQTISLSNLSSGTYFIQVKLNGRLSNTKLFFNH